MATIILQAAGAALGSVFGPVGAIVGRAVGALAGSAIDHSLFGQNGGTVERGRLSAARIPGAEEGSPLARVYGTARVAGTLIWATRFEEEVTVERAGGKGGGGARVETFRYFANFALGLCEGPIAGIRRVWADGRELDLTEIEMRLHRGTEDQPVDPLIAAKQGTQALPAYRGLATLVFERFPLERFGNRIPVIHAEVMRPVGRLESEIRAVTIIPGASEHGYDPAVVSETTGDGASRLINRNVFHAGSDWEASIDELQALCPNLQRVALVVAWFGTDLRADHCRIRPGVEVGERRDESRPWRVAGIDRAAAARISSGSDGPAYGGTPSDASVVAAIADLRARGLKVYLYPFVMMDVPPGNGLPDPYGGAEQAAFPWRGRLSCHPAPGQPGTVDGTAAARSAVERFLGTAAFADFGASGGLPVAPDGDEGYRRFVLHHAKLAALAGGVDGFILGSEMRGMTRVRDEAGAFPFVEGLVALAGDVRAALGPATKLTYAADWSEYAGLDLGGGAFRYHLDALWAAPEIDAVGIDAYLPLADWRDGDIGSGNPDGFCPCRGRYRHAGHGGGRRRL